MRSALVLHFKDIFVAYFVAAILRDVDVLSRHDVPRDPVLRWLRNFFEDDRIARVENERTLETIFCCKRRIQLATALALIFVYGHELDSAIRVIFQQKIFHLISQVPKRNDDGHIFLIRIEHVGNGRATVDRNKRLVGFLGQFFQARTYAGSRNEYFVFHMRLLQQLFERCPQSSLAWYEYALYSRGPSSLHVCITIAYKNNVRRIEVMFGNR